jgi:hypothetical protein
MLLNHYLKIHKNYSVLVKEIKNIGEKCDFQIKLAKIPWHFYFAMQYYLYPKNVRVLISLYFESYWPRKRSRSGDHII